MTKNQKISCFIDGLKLNHSKLSTHELITLLNGIKKIYHSEIIIDALVNCLNYILEMDLKLYRPLTERENQIVLMIGKGMTSIEIAESLHLSISTIETHRKNIRKKLNLKGNDSLFAFSLVFYIQKNNLSKTI